MIASLWNSQRNWRVLIVSKQDLIEMYSKLVDYASKHDIRLMVKYLQEYIWYDTTFEFQSEDEWDEDE